MPQALLQPRAQVVQHQADEIERGDSGQPLREVSKQGREVSV